MFPFDEIIMLLAPYEGNLQVTFTLLWQRTVLQSFDDFFVVSLSKLLNKQSGVLRRFEVHVTPL